MYIGRYQRFIDSLRNQRIEGVCEVHHILPVSMGGTNDKDNLIQLTPRQHYIAHWMLWKAYGGKMAQAFYFMNNLNKVRRIGGRTYEKLKAETKVELSKQFSGAGNPFYGRKMDKELRKHLSGVKVEMFKSISKDDPRIIQISKLRPSKEDYKKQGKVMSSLVWMNDGVRSYRVKPNDVDEKLNEGLVKGRIHSYIDDDYRARRGLQTKQRFAEKRQKGELFCT